jgi:hypothetical protein
MAENKIESNVKIIQTTTRLPSDNTWSWSESGKRNNIYTEEEYVEHIEPFFDFIEKTPGFLNLEFFVDDNSRSYTITYDEPYSANVAFAFLWCNEHSHEVCRNYREFSRKKREELNVSYITTTTRLY